MKVLFLCGGIGRRMFPITEDKFLLKFLGKTLLEHQFDIAVEAGLNEFLIVANQGNRDRIEKILTATSGINAALVVQENPDGIANAIESARHLLDGELIITNPNDVFETSGYLRLLESYRSNQAVAHLLAHEVSGYFPGGYLTVNSDNELTGIIEKPGEGNEPSNLVNMLVHLHTDPEMLLHQLGNTTSDNDDVYECALDKIINHALQQPVFVVKVIVRDAGVVEELLRLSLSVRLAPVGVFHDETTRLAEHTVLDVKCGAEGAAGIAGSRLDEDLFEGCLAENPAVCH